MKKYRNLRNLTNSENSKNNGITLITLILTVIVIMILAGITIQLIIGNNGLFDQATQAVIKNRIGTEENSIYLAYNTKHLDALLNKEKVSVSDIKEELDRNSQKVTVEDKDGNENKIIIVFEDTGDAFELDKSTGEIKYLGKHKGDFLKPITEADLEIKIGTSGWTNENVTTTAKINSNIDMTDYEIKYSKDRENWEKYSDDGIVSEENETIYIIVVDKITGQTKRTAQTTITIIDKENPEINNATATTNTITISATDNLSGIDGYAITSTNTLPLVSDFTNCDGAEEISVPGNKSGTTYYVWVKDKAGNISDSKKVETRNIEIATDANLKVVSTTWSEDGNATVLFETTTTYKIQLSTTNEEENFETKNSITVPNGTKIYARLWDDYNGGESYLAITPYLSYEIAYNSNGGTGTMENSEHIYGTKKKLSKNTFTRNGYSFLGWATTSTGNVEYTDENEVINLSNQDGNIINLYAVWKQDVFSVEYDANGGSGAPSTQTKISGQTLILSSEKPQRNAYAFLGWSTDKNASTATYSAGGSYTTESDVKLYAVWTKVLLSLSSTSGTSVDGSELTATISGQNYGTLSVTSSNTGIATASISGTTLKIKGTITSGTNTATITVSESNGASATYTVTAHKHTGNSSSGGGCYTVAKTGSTYVSNSCYQGTYDCNCTTSTYDCNCTTTTTYCSGCHRPQSWICDKYRSS